MESGCESLIARRTLSAGCARQRIPLRAVRDHGALRSPRLTRSLTRHREHVLLLGGLRLTVAYDTDRIVHSWRRFWHEPRPQ